MSPEDFAAIGYFKPKKGREDDCFKLAEELMRSTWAEDDGCICYYFYRRRDDPGEWIFHERWRDLESVRAHVQRLLKVYGPPDESIMPGLPGAIFEPFEKFEFVGLNPVA